MEKLAMTQELINLSWQLQTFYLERPWIHLTTWHAWPKYVDLDNIVLDGDLIIINYNDAPRVGNICKMTSSENKVQFLSQEQLEQLYVMLNVQILQVKELSNTLFWDGTFIGSPVKVAGINCLTIEPQISMTSPHQKHFLVFL